MRNFELLESNGIDVEQGIKYLGSIDAYDIKMSEFIDVIKEKLIVLKSYKDMNDFSNYLTMLREIKSYAEVLGMKKMLDLITNHEIAIQENNFKWLTDHYNELMMEIIRVISIGRQYRGENAIIATKTKNETIIIADDSSVVRNFCVKIFKNDYDVLTAIDGNEVIKLIDQNSLISALLLDISMPNCDGVKVLEYMKDHNLFNQIAVSVMISELKEKEIALAYPIVDIIVKPFSEMDIRRVVNKTISFYNK